MGTYIGVFHALHGNGEQLDVSSRQAVGGLGVGSTSGRRHGGYASGIFPRECMQVSVKGFEEKMVAEAKKVVEKGIRRGSLVWVNEARAASSMIFA